MKRDHFNVTSCNAITLTEKCSANKRHWSIISVPAKIDLIFQDSSDFLQEGREKDWEWSLNIDLGAHEEE